MAAAEKQIRQVADERVKLERRLRVSRSVEEVWESAANFILVRFRSPDAVRQALAEHRILIREFGDELPLRDCSRITVTSPLESEKLLNALDASDGMRS